MKDLIFKAAALMIKAPSHTMGQPALQLDTLDPTFYPTEDEMGEHALQRLITELLRPLIARYLALEHVKAFVGADQFIYWVQHAPTICVSPDIYVLPGVSPDIVPGCWKVWETGIVPNFALEVMAEDSRKDRLRSPDRYDELGVSELLMFDPHSAQRRSPVRFWAYRRNSKGNLFLAETLMGDRVRSAELGCYLRVVGNGDAQRLRLGTGTRGNTLFPTEAEAQEMLAYQRRVELEQERARAKEERARADAAEAELAKLRAQIEQLKGK